ncbi:MAG: SGNH/GDSL hydrolase family protein [Prevotella sp.]
MRRRNIATAIMLSLSIIIMAGGKRVLFIGDSITDGAWGNSKVWNTPSAQRNQRDMNHIYGHGYMMIAASHYEALYPEARWTFWNRGISGNTLDDLATRWQDDVLALKPDIVSVLIGTNDVDKALREGRTIDTVAWAARLRGLLDQVRAQNPDVRFVLCTPFVAKAGKIGASDDYDEREKMIRTIGCVIKKTGEEYHATVVPFDSLVEETIASTPRLPASYWIWDGIHPTPAMHYRMARMWIERVDKDILR